MPRGVYKRTEENKKNMSDSFKNRKQINGHWEKRGDNKEMLLQETIKHDGDGEGRLYKNPEWLYQERIIKGKSYNHIGKQFCVAGAAVGYFNNKFTKEGIYMKNNKNARWSKEDENKLIGLKSQGYKNSEIADKMFRTLDSIESRIRDIGIGNQKYNTNEKDIEKNVTDKPEFFKYTYNLLEELKNNPNNNSGAIENIKQEVRTIDGGFTKAFTEAHEQYTKDITQIYEKYQKMLKDKEDKINEIIEKSKIKIKKYAWTVINISNVEKEMQKFVDNFNEFMGKSKSEFPNSILKITKHPDYIYRETDMEIIKEMNRKK